MTAKQVIQSAKDKMLEMYDNLKENGFVDYETLKLKGEIDAVTMESIRIKGIQHISPVTLETMSYLLNKLWQNGIDAGYNEWKQSLDAKAVYSKTSALISVSSKLPWSIRIKNKFFSRYNDNINYIRAANRLSKEMIGLLRGRVEKQKYKYKDRLRIITRSDLIADLSKAFTRIANPKAVFRLMTHTLFAVPAFLVMMIAGDSVGDAIGNGLIFKGMFGLVVFCALASLAMLQ